MHPILADRQRLQLHLTAWGLVGAMLGSLVHLLLSSGWMESMLFALPLGLLAAPLSLSAWYLCRALPLSRTPATRVSITAVGAAVATAAIWASLGVQWWRVTVRTGPELSEASVRLLTALLVGLGALAYLVSVTVHYVLQAFEESAEASRRVLQSEIAQREAELRALRAQVDPHFLFNSLNSVSGLIGSDPERARRMCQLLADFLRDSLSLGRAPRIPLGREVALAEQYLIVEQVRFGERLAVRTAVAPDTAQLPVPPLLLQPLVENAVRHGIATCLDGGLIEIVARRAGQRAVIEILNPRDPDSGRRGTGFGLDIVRRRLAAACGDTAALTIEPGAQSYRVVLTLPLEEPAHE
jgi:hypothetical protein